MTAVKLGARVIERHFTLDKTLKGNDHSCSLNPDELAQLVREIRLIEDTNDFHVDDSIALGSYEKNVQDSERECIKKLGKTLVAARNVRQGAVLGPEDVGVKVAEPKGIPCKYFDDVVGMKAVQGLFKDDSLLWEHVCPR